MNNPYSPYRPVLPGAMFARDLDGMANSTGHKGKRRCSHPGKNHCLSLLVGLTIVAQGAGAQDINNITWNGWANQGSSVDTGVYSRGGKARDYQLYSTVFFYDSANPVPGTSSGFINGHKILGIGIRINTGAAGYPVIKLDPNNNSYSPSPDG